MGDGKVARSKQSTAAGARALSAVHCQPKVVAQGVADVRMLRLKSTISHGKGLAQ